MDWARRDLKDHLAPTLCAQDGGYSPVIIRNLLKSINTCRLIGGVRLRASSS